MAEVFNSVQDSDACENDIILVGDFNTPVDKPEWGDLKSIPGITALISATTKTSIGTSNMSHQYDDIWLQFQNTGLGHEFTGKADAYYYFNELYPHDSNPYKTAVNRVSDHVPVWAEFRTDLDDDGCLITHEILLDQHCSQYGASPGQIC